jgi:hypothetical protein
LCTRFLEEQHDVGTILQVTSEGVVRVQRDVLDPGQENRTTLLFRCPRAAGYNVVTGWSGLKHELSMSPKAGTIVQWNLQEARQTRKYRSVRSVPITCLDYEKESSHLLLAGYADGCLELFDQRQKHKSSVALWGNLGSKSLFCHLTTGQEIVSVQ